MKKFSSFILVFIILSSCLSKSKKNNTEENFTVQFEHITQTTPFESCSSLKTIKTSKTFNDSLNTFTIKVDSNWTYKYSDPDQGSIVHSFYPKNDTNLKLLTDLKHPKL